jgi:glycerate 2-kinase
MPGRNDHALSEHAARLLDAIVPAVRAAADPASAVRRAPLPDGFEPTALLATGKASAPMVEAALARPDHRFEVGAITCVPAHEQRLRAACAGRPGLTIHPADHPLATARNIEAARAVAETATTIAAERREALILISGGASAHLVSPAPGLSLEDLRATTDALLRAGATIGQLNTVRKHCETLKGGRLARLLAPARAHVLVLSDVLGDPLDTIGSGPTAPDPTTLAEAIAVLEAFSEAPVPNTVAEHLHRAGLRNPEAG